MAAENNNNNNGQNVKRVNDIMSKGLNLRDPYNHD
jgi:hypothetical protein